MPGRRQGAILVLLAGFVLAPGTGRAGETEAKFYVEKAEKAQRKKQYEEAAGYWRQALDEWPANPEAAAGLAECMGELGRTRDALEAWVLVKRLLGAAEKPNAKDRRLLRQATRAIEKLGDGYAEVEKKEGELVDSLLAYAKAHRKDEPSWAKRAYQLVLEVDPSNETAKAELEKLADVKAPAMSGPTALFAKGLDEWDRGERAPLWSVKDGVVAADMTGVAVNMWWARERLEGTFRIRGQFRVVDDSSGDFMVGMLLTADFDPRKGHAMLLGTGGHVQITKIVGPQIDRIGLDRIPDFDPKAWHTYELSVSPGRLVARVDGEERISCETDGSVPTEGFVGLNVAYGKAEFRDFEVIR